MDQPGTSEQERRTRLRVRAEDAGKIDLAALRQRFKDSTGSAPPAPPEPAPVVPEPVVPEPLPPAPVVAEPKAPFPWLRWARGVAICAGALAVLGVIGWLLVSGISSFFEGDPGKQAKPVESLPAPEPKPVVPEPEPVVPEPKPVVPEPVTPPKNVVQLVPVQVPPKILSLAEAGDVEALFLVGCLHAGKSGHPGNERLMVEHWRKAAKAGHPLAVFNLAVCRQVGLGGMASDLRAASAEFRAAEEAGFTGAQDLAPQGSTAPRPGMGWLAQAGLSLVLAVVLGILLNRYRSFQIARAGTVSAQARAGLLASLGEFVRRYGFIVFMGAWIGLVLTHESYLWDWVVERSEAYHESISQVDWLAMSLIRTLLFGLPLAALVVVLLNRWGVDLLPALEYDSRSLPAKIKPRNGATPRTYAFLVRKSPHILMIATLMWQYVLGPALDWPFYACAGAAVMVLMFLAVLDMDVLPQLNLDVPSNQRMRDSETEHSLPPLICLSPLVLIAGCLLIPVLGLSWEAEFTPTFFGGLVLLVILFLFLAKDFRPLADKTTLTFKPVPIAENEGKPTFARAPFPDSLHLHSSVTCAWWGCGLAVILWLARLVKVPGSTDWNDLAAISLLGWCIAAAVFLHIFFKTTKWHGVFRKLAHIAGLAWLLVLGCFVLMDWLPVATDFSMQSEMSFLVSFMACGLVLTGLMIRMKSGRDELNLFPSLDILPDSESPGENASPMTLLLRRKSRVILLLGSLFAMATVLPVHEAALGSDAPSTLATWFGFTMLIGVPLAAIGALIQKCHGATVLAETGKEVELSRGWVHSSVAPKQERAQLSWVNLLPFALWGVALVVACACLAMSTFSAVSLALLFTGAALALSAISRFFKPLVFYPTPGKETVSGADPIPAVRPWLQPTNEGLNIRWKPLLGATASILAISWLSAGWLVGNGVTAPSDAAPSPMANDHHRAFPPLTGLNGIKRHAAGFLVPADPLMLSPRPGDSPHAVFSSRLSFHLGNGQPANRVVHENRTLPDSHIATLEGRHFLCVWQRVPSLDAAILKRIHVRPRLVNVSLKFRSNRKIRLGGRTIEGDRVNKLYEY